MIEQEDVHAGQAQKWEDPLLKRAREAGAERPVDPVSTVEAEEAGAPTFEATKRRNRRFHRRHPILVGVAAVLAVLMVPLMWSYGQALTAPGEEGYAARSAEWMRDHQMGGVVNWVERRWYELNKPKVGGTPGSIVLPVVASSPSLGPTTSAGGTTIPGATTSSTAATSIAPAPHLVAPAAVVSPAGAPVAGEGVWVPLAPQADGVPAGYLTQIRPDAVHTSTLVLVAWMDPNRASFKLFPGTKVPGGTWQTPSRIPADLQPSLISAFNGGFRLEDARGGYYAEGRVAKPLRDGAASLVIDSSGRPNVVMWGRDAQLGPGIDVVRQNLDLLVDGGVLAPDLNVGSSPKWGWTLGNETFVARSGIGVTADGALLYVGGPAMSVKTLAETLQRAGAVRAMEMDINEDWISYNVYSANAAGKVDGRKALPSMKVWGGRYLGTDSRDFIGVFHRPLAGG